MKMNIDDVNPIVDAIRNAGEPPEAPTKSDEVPNGPHEKSSVETLLRLAKSRCKFFHDADGRGYAYFDQQGHRETWAIDSRGFKDWLGQEYFRSYGRVPADLALATACTNLNAQAKYDWPEQEVYLRVAKFEGSYWVDLCDESWSAVRFNQKGWEIVENPPVFFIRTSAMRALPIPVENGSLLLAWKLFNIPQDDHSLFLAVWSESLRPETPHLVTEFVGKKGTSKSTTQDFMRRFIDPNKSNLRAPTKSTEDLVATAANSYVVSFENVSHLSDEQQDDLCRLTTGSGFAKRRLYTDNEECVVSLKRPVFMNGISANATQADLLDRTVSFELRVPDVRLTNDDLEAHFEAEKSRIMGALLDLAVEALRHLDGTSEFDQLPRMADFARWGEAVYRALGHEKGRFLADYEENRKASSMRVIECSPVAMTIKKFLDERNGYYEGTIGRLLDDLEHHRPNPAFSQDL